MDHENINANPDFGLSRSFFDDYDEILDSQNEYYSNSDVPINSPERNLIIGVLNNARKEMFKNPYVVFDFKHVGTFKELKEKDFKDMKCSFDLNNGQIYDQTYKWFNTDDISFDDNHLDNFCPSISFEFTCGVLGFNKNHVRSYINWLHNKRASLLKQSKTFIREMQYYDQLIGISPKDVYNEAAENMCKLKTHTMTLTYELKIKKTLINSFERKFNVDLTSSYANILLED